MICLVDCNWWLWIQTICILSTFCIHIQFTPPKTALKKPVKASSRHEKTDLARFGLPFLQRWVTWAASGCDGQPPFDGNLSHTSIDEHPVILRRTHGGQLWLQVCNSSTDVVLPCFALFYHFLPFYVWICAVAKPFWDSSISKRDSSTRRTFWIVGLGTKKVVRNEEEKV